MVRVEPGGLNSAWIVFAALIVTVQVKVAPVPSQPAATASAPCQPLKTSPPVGEAVSLTVCPSAYSCSQVAPHSTIPPSLTPLRDEVTVPLPVPVLVTVSLNCGNRAP